MLTPAFARRRGMDGEGVDAVLELADKCRVDHAVALEPALSAKRFRDDIDPEMSLTARPVPCMPCMLHSFQLPRVSLTAQRKLSR